MLSFLLYTVEYRSLSAVYRVSGPSDRYFSPGKTYIIYVGHLIKACHLMGIEISWRDDLVNSIANDIANKPNPKRRFHNSSTPRILDRIFRAESWKSEFARLCYVASLHMIRLPSEALILHRALHWGETLSARSLLFQGGDRPTRIPGRTTPYHNAGHSQKHAFSIFRDAPLLLRGQRPASTA